MKKREIDEIIDSDGNLIGSETRPTTGGNRESEANKTTDYNVNVHGQNFKNDFLGRFGFYFYESEEDASKLRNDLAELMYNKYLETMQFYYEHPDLLKKDFEFHKDADFQSQPEDKRELDFDWADKVMDIIEPHLKKKLDESKVVEDKVVQNKDDKNLKEKKDADNDLNDKTKKVLDLIGKLPEKDVDKLKNILEDK